MVFRTCLTQSHDPLLKTAGWDISTITIQSTFNGSNFTNQSSYGTKRFRMLKCNIRCLSSSAFSFENPNNGLFGFTRRSLLNQSSAIAEPIAEPAVSGFSSIHKELYKGVQRLFISAACASPAPIIATTRSGSVSREIRIDTVATKLLLKGREPVDAPNPSEQNQTKFDTVSRVT